MCKYYSKCHVLIVRTPTLFKVNFNYLHWRRDSEKLRKGWKCGARAGLLKSGGRAGTFPIYFFEGLPFLHLEITLLFAKLCYAFE